MKKLYIIRHAKSSWSDMSLDDLDRPLNKRGKKNAPFMGRLLKEKGVKPDIIISSPALRAKKTAMAIASEVPYEKEIEYDEKIYESDADMLKSIIKNISDDSSTLFLVGHNPALNQLAYELVGFSDNIVTSGILEIEFDCDRWCEIDAKNSKLISFEYPKKYN